MSLLNPELSKPRINNIPLPVRLLIVALLIGGLTGGITNLVAGSISFWVWEMPILAYRFLAAAAFAYVAGSLLTLKRNSWVESELLIATVNFYGWPLLLAILLQPEVINWGQFMAWSFVAVVTPALIISVTYLWKNRRLVRMEATVPLSHNLRYFLVGLGIVALAVGLLVFIVPKQAGFIWPWSELKAWKILDSRLIASMLITISGGAFLVAWRNDRGAAQVFLGMLTTYCVVANIGIGLHASITPAFVLQDVIYIIVFSLMLLMSLVLYLGSPSSSQPHK